VSAFEKHFEIAHSHGNIVLVGSVSGFLSQYRFSFFAICGLYWFSVRYYMTTNKRCAYNRCLLVFILVIICVPLLLVLVDTQFVELACDGTRYENETIPNASKSFQAVDSQNVSDLSDNDEDSDGDSDGDDDGDDDSDDDSDGDSDDDGDDDDDDNAHLFNSVREIRRHTRSK